MEAVNFDFSKYTKMISKRRYLFIVVSLLVMSVIVWGSFFLPKKYEASSTVFIEKNVIKDLVKGITYTPSVEDKIRVLKYAMMSRVFITKILHELDLDAKAKSPKELEEMVQEYQKKTQINVKGNDLFIVTYRHEDPKVARDYINSLVGRYVEQNVSQKREESYGANQFLSDQLKSFKLKIDNAEENIIKFRQQKGVVIAIDEGMLVQEIKKYQTDLEGIKIKKNELLAVRDNLRKQLKREEPLTVAFLSSKRPEGGSAEITALENKVKQLMVNYTDNYPEVVRLKTMIEALKKQNSAKPRVEESVKDAEMSTMNPIYQSIKQQLGQTESEIDALSARESQTRAAIGAKERELRNIPEDRKKLSDLQKERDASKQIYDQLVTRQGQAELGKQMEVEDKATTFRIVDPAILPKKPVSPDRVKLIMMGIVAGIVAGAGAVFLRETLDNTIKDVAQLRSFGFEVLATIPTIIDEFEQQKVNKRDRIVYLTAGCYMLLIFFSLVHEIAGFTFIERVLSHLGVDSFKL